MTKDLSLDELREKLQKARVNYINCGCKIYREEINALTARIRELEAQIKTA